ncbi:pilus assembly protein PilP [Candidatus Pelagibacter sp.]|jgi:hypothetical protein|nr:pilus assembly protein PilP [Candidatus Pelagibacter sp.]
MNSFKNFFFITILLLLTGNVFADNHSTDTELVEKAKEITKEIENKQSQVDEDEVPLNDPFAGSEGTSNSTVNPETGEERDEMSLYNFKLSGLISGKDESYISLTNTSGDVITLNLNQYLGKIKFIDLRLTEAIFEKEDKSFIIIDFNNQIREADEY